LFLGEWCRVYERRRIWEARDVQVLGYHWDDRKKLERDYHQLLALGERLLEPLAASLNETHGTDFPVRYWRILVGPWLGYFLQICFDRWECIQRALQWDLSGTVVLAHEHNDIPADMDDFTARFLDDRWNHALMVLMLKRTGIRLIERAATVQASVRRSADKNGLKAAIRFAATFVATRLATNKAVVMNRSYLPPLDEAILHIRLGQMPQVWRFATVERAAVDLSRRQWTLSFEASDTFEDMVAELIPLQLPTAYLEGYAALTMQVTKLGWPQDPRAILTSNSHINDEVFKAWAAQKVVKGSALIIGQHGGHFGIGRWNFQEDHEKRISDRYLSWGWSEPNDPRVVPVGQLKGKRPFRVNHALQPNALLVTCEVPRYSYWMYSITVAGQYLQYLEDQYEFVNRLPERIRRRLLVRLYRNPWPTPFWSQSARMRERLPDVRFDDGWSPIDDLIRQSRLYISTYNATTFLESLSMNVPTVVFWNPQHWEVRDSARKYLELLEKAGIFHPSPLSAARHVELVWDDVMSWWNSASVRTAIGAFVDRFSRTPDHLIDRLAAVIKDVRQSPRA
jgi:putative transferase (TIGR04331 family)